MVKKLKSLDVGCGSLPRGHVNVDLHPNMTIHRDHNTVIDQERTKRFVVADAHYLPFEDNTFEKTTCYHVLEHLDNPLQALKELVRVTKTLLEIQVPHAFYRHPFQFWRDQEHVNYFRCRWFHKALKNYPHTARVSFQPVPHSLLPLVSTPKYIDVKVFLNKS